MRGKQVSGFPPAEEALKDFFEAWTPSAKKEYVPLDSAAWRITAETMCSKNTLPPYRTSGGDGIAVSSADFADGMPDYKQWKMGVEFDRADTGDDFDDKYDAVIMIEEVDLNEDGSIAFISEDVKVESGTNVDPPGSTLAEGAPVIDAGLPLRPTDLAALAMSGWSMVPVVKKPRVAFIPTGSELISHRMQPVRGQNVDTNTLMVGEMLKRMGAEPVIWPIIKDAKAELREALLAAVETCDMVIINGGTAKGGEDFNSALLEEYGKLIHHYVAVAPGRPLAMAVIDGKPVVNLPGPTLAAFVGMDWCVHACVNRLMGLPMPKRTRVSVVLEHDIRSGPTMTIYCRMKLTRQADGTYTARQVGFGENNMAIAMTSDALFVSPIGSTLHPKGSTVEVELLRGEEFIKG